MNDAVNLEKLLISNPYGSKNEFESVATFEESDPYIRWLSIDFALENEAGSSSVFIYGEAEKADDAARLFGALILGEQALRDGEDLRTSATLATATFTKRLKNLIARVCLKALTY